MQVVRRLGGGLLWMLASLLGLVSIVLCITVILLPLGIPLLLATRRLFRAAVRLWAPRAVSHPVDELSKKSRRKGRAVRKSMPTPPKPKSAGGTPKKLRKEARRARKRLQG